MRRFAAYALVAASVLACQAKLFTISVAQEDQVLVEKGTILEQLLGDFGFGGFVSMTPIDSEELQNQGVAPGDIKDVRLVFFELEASSPAGADLAFIDALDIYVEAPGLPQVLLASASDFPEGQAVVAFEIEDVDLTEYVVSEALTLTTDVTAQRPEVDTTVTARFELDVGVTGQGACNQAKGDGNDGG